MLPQKDMVTRKCCYQEKRGKRRGQCCGRNAVYPVVHDSVVMYRCGRHVNAHVRMLQDSIGQFVVTRDMHAPSDEEEQMERFFRSVGILVDPHQATVATTADNNMEDEEVMDQGDVAAVNDAPGTCDFILVRGLYKGQACGNKAKGEDEEGNPRCGRHLPGGKKRSRAAVDNDGQEEGDGFVEVDDAMDLANIAAGADHNMDVDDDDDEDEAPKADKPLRKRRTKKQRNELHERLRDRTKLAYRMALMTMERTMDIPGFTAACAADDDLMEMVGDCVDTYPSAVTLITHPGVMIPLKTAIHAKDAYNKKRARLAQNNGAQVPDPNQPVDRGIYGDNYYNDPETI